MELQWEKQTLSCLQHKVRQVQTQELTQELRLPDSLQDVGRVICCWGQPVLRSKEWSSDGIRISCGVTAWVLYEPENGCAPQTAEVWMPCQMRWSFPQSQRDGTIHSNLQLSSIDARVLSARKLMVRCSISVLAEAMEPVLSELYKPTQDVDGLHLLQKHYPLRHMVEAGEKLVNLEENIPCDGPWPLNIVCCKLNTHIEEAKIVDDKAVFRGSTCLHALYQTEEGQLCALTKQISLAQFSELDCTPSEAATVCGNVVVSGLELDIGPEQLLLRASLVIQYIVTEQTMLQLATDAYSNTHQLQLQQIQTQIPAVLDHCCQSVDLAASVPIENGQILDVACYLDHPAQYKTNGAVEMELPAVFQILSCDENGTMRLNSHPCKAQWSLPADENSDVAVSVHAVSAPAWVKENGQLACKTMITMDVGTSTQQSMSMLKGLEIGELLPQSEDKPTLILRRSGPSTLWELAKNCGSTVDAIRSANGLEGEPAANQLLLIPVI